MMVVIKVDKEKQILTDCKWKTYGCASAIASTSVMSEMVKGMSIEQAYHLTPKDVAKELGGLPEHKIHLLGSGRLKPCAPQSTIITAKNGMEDKITKEEARIVCQCMNVTDHEIEEAVLEGARSYLSLQEKTKIGTVCGQCKEETLRLMDVYIGRHFGDRK